MAVKAVTAAQIEELEGEWVAEDGLGHVLAHAKTLPELERILVEEKRFKEDHLPAIRRVPEDGQSAFIL